MANTESKVIVYKGRTTVLPVSLGEDVSLDTFTSEIRTPGGTLIAEWNVAFDGDGTDGELIFTLDDSVSGPIEYSRGLMDVKRISNGEPLPVFEALIEVEFRDTVTA